MRHAAICSTAVLTGAGLTLVACGYDPFSGPGTDTEANSGLAPSEVENEEPEAFGEIREEVFGSMLAAESVTITGQVEAGDAELDELFDGIEGDTTGQLEISGAIEGTDSQMSFSAGGSSFTQRAVDGGEYFRGEDFAALLASELDEDVSEVVDEEFIAEIVSDQWVQFDDAQNPSVFSAEDFITTWAQELEGESVSQMPGEAESREGQNVWVYSADDGESEFVVSAEADPYLMSIRDGDSHYTFTQWNSSEGPEAPQEVITLDEIFDAIVEEQGWSVEDEDVSDAGGESDPQAGT